MMTKPDLTIIAGAPAEPKDPAGDIEQPGTTDLVPLDVLGMPDDQEQMQPPAVGDEVNYSVTGKVTAITGNVATIERTSINGKPIDDNDGDTAGAESEDGLQAEAAQMDTKGLGA
jgi:hypothetical protein